MAFSVAGKRQLGRTAIELAPVGFGGAAIMFRTPTERPAGFPVFNGSFRTITDEQARLTMQAAWDHGIRHLDTAPWYGRGGSEYRVGRFASQEGHREGGGTLSTKVGRVLRPPAPGATPSWQQAGVVASRNPAGPTYGGGLAVGDNMSRVMGGMPFEFHFDYSYDGIMRSYHDSVQRMGTSAIDMLLVHDLDSNHHTAQQEQAHLHTLATSGSRALEELKATGCIKGWGSGINEANGIHRILDHADVDFLLVSQCYTLGDHSALTTPAPAARSGLSEGVSSSSEGANAGASDEGLSAMARVEQAGIGVLAATVFNAGIMHSGPVPGAVFNYNPATSTQLELVRRMQVVCERHSVPLAAAALQFPLHHPSVCSAVVGMAAPEEVEQNVRLLEMAIPPALWDEMKAEGLVHERAPTPTARGA